MLTWLTMILAVLAGIFFVLQTHAGGTAELPRLPIAAGVIAMLAALYLATLRTGWRESSGNAIRGLGLAVAAAAIGWIAYNAANSPSPFAGNPQAGTSKGDGVYSASGPGSVRLRRRDDGTFLARGELNGSATDFVVDTGAATVMLRQSDAEKAGIDVKDLSFTTPVATANGTAYAAPVRIRIVAIGPLRIDDVEALVAKPGSLNESLLGMNFLRRLTSYELAGDFLTLRQ